MNSTQPALHTDHRREPTSWELTAEALGLTAPTDTIGSTVYEVGADDAWITTTHDVFAAWTADRRINGSDHHGPIYNIGTTITYTGPRSCPCSTCQATVAPHHRKD